MDQNMNLFKTHQAESVTLNLSNRHTTNTNANESLLCQICRCP